MRDYTPEEPISCHTKCFNSTCGDIGSPSTIDEGDTVGTVDSTVSSTISSTVHKVDDNSSDVNDLESMIEEDLKINIEIPKREKLTEFLKEMQLLTPHERRHFVSMLAADNNINPEKSSFTSVSSSTILREKLKRDADAELLKILN